MKQLAQNEKVLNSFRLPKVAKDWLRTENSGSWVPKVWIWSFKTLAPGYQKSGSGVYSVASLTCPHALGLTVQLSSVYSSVPCQFIAIITPPNMCKYSKNYFL